MSKKRKPFDPAKAELDRLKRRAKEEQAARDGGGVTLDPTLPAHAETHIAKDAAGRCTRAWRSNVVSVLHRAGTIQMNHVLAANHLAEKWAAWKGLEGKPEVVGSSQGSRDLITDRMVKAGKKVAELLSEVSPTSRKLLEAFMVATVEEDRPMVWRGIVQRETAEANEKRQTRLVVTAFEELRRSWEGEAPKRLHPFGVGEGRAA